MPLKLWSSDANAVFFQDQFTFFDCGASQLSVHSCLVFCSAGLMSVSICRCVSCVSSRWHCEWCLMDNRCVHTGRLCSNQVPEFIFAPPAVLDVSSSSSFGMLPDAIGAPGTATAANVRVQSCDCSICICVLYFLRSITLLKCTMLSHQLRVQGDLK